MERPFTTDIISLTGSIYKIVPYLYVNALKVIQIYHKSEGLKIRTFIFRHKCIKLINLHWYSSRLAILSSFWEAVKPRVVQRFTSCCELIRVWIGYLEGGNNTNCITLTLPMLRLLLSKAQNKHAKIFENNLNPVILVWLDISSWVLSEEYLFARGSVICQGFCLYFLY